MLSLNPCLPHHGKQKRRKRKRDLQNEYKSSFTKNIYNIDYINNKRNNAKYTKPILSFPEVDATGTGVLSAAARQHQEVLDWP